MLNSHEKHRTQKDSSKPYTKVAANQSSGVSSVPSAFSVSASPAAAASSWTQWGQQLSVSVTLPLQTLEESLRREREHVAAEEHQFETDISYRMSPKLLVEEELARMEEDNLHLSAADHRMATISNLSSSGASTGAVPSPTPSSTSTIFHVRNGGGRRAFINPSQAERLTLVFFTGAEPRILEWNEFAQYVAP
ncbi:hypothetical protein B0H16DRAFT_1456119 [Mycena metata]|uniref:Uncharacterized protein n=1 Tax=Mycena metata TaxID=1033252 RepID=A0AAD7NIH6_9AGAR|nr:hypothetical protein B0H16DRAFT_1456119 [Mycena metata]